MTDVYVLKHEENEESPPNDTIFIGYPLTGGYGVYFCQKCQNFEVAPERYIDDTMSFINSHRDKIKPRAIGEGKKWEFAEGEIDLLVKEIEKLTPHKGSEELTRRLNSLLSLLNLN